MPWLNARTDLIGAQLRMDELGAVERSWAAAWDEAMEVEGVGALARVGPLGVAGRAEMELSPAGSTTR